MRAPDPTADRIGVGWADDHTMAPVTVPLAEGDHLGIAGPTPWADAVARGVVLQALSRCGPIERSVDGGPDETWGFLRWVPHREGDGAPLTIGVGATGADTGLGIEIADQVSALSDRCRAVLTWSPEGARLTEAAVAVRPFVADPTLAEDWARAMARWTDPGTRNTALPDHVRLPRVLAGDREDPDPSGRRSLRAPLGVGAEGVVVVDLVADGPHALVAGTTGAGKSELLRTWVAALAARHPPTAVAFVLVDYKGGSAFDACARLPHVTGVVTDLDAGLGERLLTGLRAEVRERRVPAARPQGSATCGTSATARARLVVVVDEFATLAAELPDFLGALVDVARRGRSLGVHLVLATQRPAGAVNDDIRANTALRLCLRTLDPADSQDVIGGPDAAALPARTPGRAWVRTGAGLRLLQVADSGAREERLPPVVARRVGAPWPSASDPAPTDLDRLVDDAVADWGDRPNPAPVWRPPLPEHLTVPVGQEGRGRGPRSTGPAGRADPTPAGLGTRRRASRGVRRARPGPHDRPCAPPSWPWPPGGRPTPSTAYVVARAGAPSTTSPTYPMSGRSSPYRTGPPSIAWSVASRPASAGSTAPQLGPSRWSSSTATRRWRPTSTTSTGCACSVRSTGSPGTEPATGSSSR